MVASGIYDWLRRDVSQQQQANETLYGRIREIHEAGHQTYGYPRIHAVLREAGEAVGENRVVRIMTHMNLKTRCQRRFRVTAQPNAHRTSVPTN